MDKVIDLEEYRVHTDKDYQEYVSYVYNRIKDLRNKMDVLYDKKLSKEKFIMLYDEELVSIALDINIKYPHYRMKLGDIPCTWSLGLNK